MKSLVSVLIVIISVAVIRPHEVISECPYSIIIVAVIRPHEVNSVI